ncbi:hypothetical protein BN1723_016358, partial [Verticillium longisporum]
MAAWVNMLLLSSSGPIKTPVGACATSVESVDIGYETIMEGKAKIVFVGGFDDFGEEGSYEFANMKATSNAVDELAHGRTPKEILRKDIMETSETRRIVAKENAIENKVVNGPDSELLYKKKLIEPRANMKFDFPPLPDWDAEIAPLNDKLKGMVDLEKVVVVTGFAEVGPWGNSRTRWEMEAYGEFSIEGCVEMAWIMGLIKNHNGPIKGKPYSGWVDAKTGDPIEDKDIKPKFEKHILEHSGIRLIEPELFDGYDPNQKQLLHEVVIEEDLEPFEASKETAEEFKREHGDKVEIFEIPESGEYIVRMKKGAGLWIPKALRFDRLVAGQIPTGWDAKKYGVPEDIIDQVDPVTLFVLVSVAEALLSSGVTDPYEFYKYVHVSEALLIFIVVGSHIVLERFFSQWYFRLAFVIGYALTIIFLLSAWAWAASIARLFNGDVCDAFGCYSNDGNGYGSAMAAG